MARDERDMLVAFVRYGGTTTRQLLDRREKGLRGLHEETAYVDEFNGW